MNNEHNEACGGDFSARGSRRDEAGGSEEIRLHAQAAPPEGHPPGDIIFTTGVGQPLDARCATAVVRHPVGAFRFRLGGSERDAIVIGPDGEFSVEGKPVANDRQVYEAFKAWLSAARCRHERGVCIVEPAGAGCRPPEKP